MIPPARERTVSPSCMFVAWQVAFHLPAKAGVGCFGSQPTRAHINWFGLDNLPGGCLSGHWMRPALVEAVAGGGKTVSEQRMELELGGRR